MLRTFAIVLGLTMSLNALAATNVQDQRLTKTPDGKILKCEENFDLNRPGYKPTLFFVLPKNDGIEVTISLAAMTCLEKPTHDGYELAIRRMNDPLPSMAIQGLPATLVFDHQDATLVSSRLDILGSIEAENEMMQTFRYPLAPNQFLTAREMNDLEHGKAIRVKQMFLVRTASHVETAYGRSEIQASAGGSYTIEFTIEKIANKLMVTNQSLR